MSGRNQEQTKQGRCSVEKEKEKNKSWEILCELSQRSTVKFQGGSSTAQHSVSRGFAVFFFFWLEFFVEAYPTQETHFRGVLFVHRANPRGTTTYQLPRPRRRRHTGAYRYPNHRLARWSKRARRSVQQNSNPSLLGPSYHTDRSSLDFDLLLYRPPCSYQRCLPYIRSRCLPSPETSSALRARPRASYVSFHINTHSSSQL